MARRRRGNPAGLSQLRKPEFSLVYTVGYRGLGLDGMRSPDGRVAYSNRQFGYVSVRAARTSEWRKLSAIYRIPDTEKLRGLVRKIFG